MIYCVVPKPLADELLGKLTELLRGRRRTSTVIVERREFDRRARRGRQRRASRRCRAAHRPRPPPARVSRRHAPARPRLSAHRGLRSRPASSRADEADRPRRRRRPRQPRPRRRRRRDRSPTATVLAEPTQAAGHGHQQRRRVPRAAAGAGARRRARGQRGRGRGRLRAGRQAGPGHLQGQATRPCARCTLRRWRRSGVRAVVDPHRPAGAERPRRRARQRAPLDRGPPDGGPRGVGRTARPAVGRRRQCRLWADLAIASIWAFERSSSSVFVTQ